MLFVVVVGCWLVASMIAGALLALGATVRRRLAADPDAVPLPTQRSAEAARAVAPGARV